MPRFGPIKPRLLELLDEQLARAEEGMWEQDLTVQAETREARAAYWAGDYMSIDEYVARRLPRKEVGTCPLN